MTLEYFCEYFNPVYKKEIKKLFSHFCLYSKNKNIDNLIKKTLDLSSGGKRIRAYVCALSYEAKNKQDLAKIKNQLIAIELLHFFALIHDDVMDNSTMRHGKKTINSFGKKENEILKSKNESIIIGDLIFSYSYRLFLKDNKSEESISVFDTLIEEVIFGQTLDLELSQELNYTQDNVISKMLYKTARYTFTRPIQIGILLRNEPRNISVLKKLEVFGDSIGMMFQIDDDLLDIFGDTKITNKNTFQDIEGFQATILTSFVFENKKYKKQLTSYLGKTLTEKDKLDLKNIFIESGALNKTTLLKEKYIKTANNNLIGSPEFNIAWKNLITTLSNRKK